MLPTRTILEVKDNGCGYINTNSYTPGSWKSGLGNWNMYQLAARFNGELEIESHPGKGTVVRCTIPKKCEMGDILKEAASK
jgi:signal transduction histidine kinase